MGAMSQPSLNSWLPASFSASPTSWQWVSPPSASSSRGRRVSWTGTNVDRKIIVSNRIIQSISRSWISGVTSLEVMLAHVVAQFVVMVVQVTFVLVFMLLVFQVSDCLVSENKSIMHEFAFCLQLLNTSSFYIHLGSCPRTNILGSNSNNSSGIQII